MKDKKTIKIIIDTAMLILLPLLMAYSLIGEAAHEWLGLSMFLLFILHHIMNHSNVCSCGQSRRNASYRKEKGRCLFKRAENAETIETRNFKK